MEKDIISLGGEFAVASQLCRKGLFPLITLGRYKATDIFIEKNDILIKIQVKTKNTKNWGNIKGICGKNSFLVLVDHEKENNDFYILDENDWLRVVNSAYKKKIIGGELCIDEKNRPVFVLQKVKRTEKAYSGVEIKVDHIQEYKNRWDKIEKAFQDEKIPRIGKIKELKLTRILKIVEVNGGKD